MTWYHSLAAGRPSPKDGVLRCLQHLDSTGHSSAKAAKRAGLGVIFSSPNSSVSDLDTLAVMDSWQAYCHWHNCTFVHNAMGANAPLEEQLQSILQDRIWSRFEWLLLLNAPVLVTNMSRTHATFTQPGGPHVVFALEDDQVSGATLFVATTRFAACFIQRWMRAAKSYLNAWATNAAIMQAILEMVDPDLSDHCTVKRHQCNETATSAPQDQGGARCLLACSSRVQPQLPYVHLALPLRFYPTMGGFVRSMEANRPRGPLNNIRQAVWEGVYRHCWSSDFMRMGGPDIGQLWLAHTKRADGVQCVALSQGAELRIAKWCCLWHYPGCINTTGGYNACRHQPHCSKDLTGAPYASCQKLYNPWAVDMMPLPDPYLTSLQARALGSVSGGGGALLPLLASTATPPRRSVAPAASRVSEDYGVYFLPFHGEVAPRAGAGWGLGSGLGSAEPNASVSVWMWVKCFRAYARPADYRRNPAGVVVVQGFYAVVPRAPAAAYGASGGTGAAQGDGGPAGGWTPNIYFSVSDDVGHHGWSANPTKATIQMSGLPGQPRNRRRLRPGQVGRPSLFTVTLSVSTAARSLPMRVRIDDWVGIQLFSTGYCARTNLTTSTRTRAAAASPPSPAPAGAAGAAAKATKGGGGKGSAPARGGGGGGGKDAAAVAGAAGAGGAPLVVISRKSALNRDLARWAAWISAHAAYHLCLGFHKYVVYATRDQLPTLLRMGELAAMVHAGSLDIVEWPLAQLVAAGGAGGGGGGAGAGGMGTRQLQGRSHEQLFHAHTLLAFWHPTQRAYVLGIDLDELISARKPPQWPRFFKAHPQPVLSMNITSWRCTHKDQDGIPLLRSCCVRAARATDPRLGRQRALWGNWMIPLPAAAVGPGGAPAPLAPAPPRPAFYSLLQSPPPSPAPSPPPPATLLANSMEYEIGLPLLGDAAAAGGEVGYVPHWELSVMHLSLVRTEPSGIKFNHMDDSWQWVMQGKCFAGYAPTMSATHAFSAESDVFPLLTD